MKQLTRSIFLALLMTLSAAGPLLAQFTISAEFRPRLEYRNGYSKLIGSDKLPVFDILGRNRLIFDYKDERFSARFSIQHAYVFGENNYSSDTITRNTLNLYEAWFQYDFVKNVGIRIGRMELAYDDQRLLGVSNWNPKGSSHDVGVFKWGCPEHGYRGDFGFAINNTGPMGAFLTAYPLKNYKYLLYLYEQKKFLKDQLVVGLIGIADVLQKPGSKVSVTTYDSLPVYDNSGVVIGYTLVPHTTTTLKYDPKMLYARVTAGGNVGFTWKNLKVFAAGYYQGGSFSNGNRISASFYGVYASYQVVKQLKLMAGYDRLSGNDYSDTAGIRTKYTSFSTLYSSTHGFYGYMDYWGTYVGSGTTPGLTNLYARATVSFSENLSLEATWRMMGLSRGYLEVKDPDPGELPYLEVKKNLGHEIDLMCIYKPVKNLELNAAYCLYFPTETMELLQGLKAGDSGPAHYAYVMLTYKPTFFNSDRK